MTRFQFNALVRAAIAGAGVVAGSSVYWPTPNLGQNVPLDSSFTTMPVYNDRAVVTGLYDTSISAHLPQASLDPVTGLPTVAFGIKLCEGSLSLDPMVTGTWFVYYTGVADATPSLPYGGTIVSSTFSGGIGRVQISHTAGNVLAVVFHVPVTGFHAYMPATSAAAIAGGPSAVPRWATQFLRTVTPYTYMRMMDVQQTNVAYQTPQVGGFQTDFKTSIGWADRPTPANLYANFFDNRNGGMPIEWQVDLLNQTGKDGWFHIPVGATDDYITNFATYVAQNLGATQTAIFAYGNEVWNAFLGSYSRAAYAGMADALAAESTAQNIGVKSNQVTSFAVDASNNCTVTFTQPHGGSVGVTPVLKGTNTGYATLVPTGPISSVPSPTTIVYPCSYGSAATLAGTTVLTSSGFIALNPSSTILQLCNSVYDMRQNFYYRRAFEMATLVRAAFTAVGRTQAQCQPVLEMHAGDQYGFGNKHIGDYIAAAKGGATLSSVFKAAAVGGYLGLAQGGIPINPGYGLTKSATDPSLITEAAVNAQLQQVVDAAPGAFMYTSTASWAAAQGLELWGYEIGWDLSAPSGETTAMRTAKEAWQTDYATYGAQQEAMVLAWLRNLQRLGFKRIGWYQCGAGTYAGTYAGNGCFNLGQTANEIDYTTAPSGQSPKFRALLDSKQPPTTRNTRHAVPCVLSGWDCVGNEAVVTTAGVWPALSGTNLPYGFAGYAGPLSNGQTYEVWSETAQTVTCTIVGDNTSGSNRTVSVLPLGGTESTFSAPHNTANGTLGSCSVALQAGTNWVFISCPTAPANIFPHTVQFG